MNPTEIKRFLRETWELWSWAMFCPSKLQQRMNEWSPQPEKDGRRPDTTFLDIFLKTFNFRFFCQSLCIIVVLSLPLILKIGINERAVDGWLILMILITAYETIFIFLYLSLGFTVPILFS